MNSALIISDAQWAKLAAEEVLMQKILFVMALNLSACFTVHGANETVASALESVRQDVRQHNRINTTIIVRHWAPASGNAPPRTSPEPFLVQRTLQLLVRGEIVCIREHLRPSAEEGLAAATVNSTWDGHLWYSEAGRDQSRTLNIETKPHIDNTTDCLGLMHGIEYASFVHSSVARALRDFVVLEQSEDQTMIRVLLTPNEDRTKVCELTFEKSNHLRMRSAVVEFFSAPLDVVGRRATCRVSYVVDEWGEYEGRVLPKRATREIVLDTDSQRAKGMKPQRSISTFERVEAKFDAAEPTWDCCFGPPPFADSNVLVDRTLHLAYRVGSGSIQLDGQQFQLQAPIREIPRRDLTDVMKNAKSAQAPGDNLNTKSLRYDSPDEKGRQFFSRDVVIRAAIFGLCGTIAGMMAMVSMTRSAESATSKGKGWRLAIGCGVLACAVGLGTAGPSTPSEDESPLTGEKSFDFGEVTNTTGGRLTLSHEFKLRNNANKTLKIERVSASCGCVKTTVSDTVITSGAETAIGAAIEVQGLMRRQEKVWVLLGDGAGTIELNLAVKTRSTQDFYVAEVAVPLHRTLKDDLILVALTSGTGEKPEAPVIVAPENVKVDLGPWLLVYPESVEQKRGARWQANVELTCDGGGIADRAKLQVRYGDKNTEVDLTGVPWD